MKTISRYVGSIDTLEYNAITAALYSYEIDGEVVKIIIRTMHK